MSRLQYIFIYVVLYNLKQSTPYWTSIIPRTGWRKLSKCRIESLELYSMFDRSDPNSFLNQVNSASASAQVKKEVDTSAQSAGIGSYFNSMGGGAQSTAPKPQDSTAQSAGIGSYFDQMSGAASRTPEDEARIEAQRKADEKSRLDRLARLGGSNPTPIRPAGNSGGAVFPGQSPNAGGAVFPGQSPNAGGAVFPGQSPNAGGAVFPGQSPNAGGAVFPRQSPNASGAVFPGQRSNAGGAVFPGQSSNAGGAIFPGQSPNAGGAAFPTPTPPANQGVDQSRLDRLSRLGGPSGGSPPQSSNAGGPVFPTQPPSPAGNLQTPLPPRPGQPQMQPPPGGQMQGNPMMSQMKGPPNMGSPGQMGSPQMSKGPPSMGSPGQMGSPQMPQMKGPPKIGSPGQMGSPQMSKGPPNMGSPGQMGSPQMPQMKGPPKIGSPGQMGSPQMSKGPPKIGSPGQMGSPPMSKGPPNMGSPGQMGSPQMPQMKGPPKIGSPGQMGSPQMSKGPPKIGSPGQMGSSPMSKGPPKIGSPGQMGSSPMSKEPPKLGSPNQLKGPPKASGIGNNDIFNKMKQKSPGIGSTDAFGEMKTKSPSMGNNDLFKMKSSGMGSNDKLDELKKKAAGMGSNDIFNQMKQTKKPGLDKLGFSSNFDDDYDDDMEQEILGRSMKKTMEPSRTTNADFKRTSDSMAERLAAERISAEKDKFQSRYDAASRPRPSGSSIGGNRSTRDRYTMDDEDEDDYEDSYSDRKRRRSSDVSLSRKDVDRDLVDALFEAQQRARDIENKRYAMQGSKYSDRAAFEERLANQDRISEDIRMAIEIYEQIIADEEAKIAALRRSSLTPRYPSSTLENFDPKLIWDPSLPPLDVEREPYSTYDDDTYSQDERLASEIVDRRKKEYQGYDSSDELFRRVNLLKNNPYSNTPLRNYPEQTTSWSRNSKPSSGNFFQRLLPSFKGSSSDSFNNYEQRNIGRNSGTRGISRSYTANDSSLATLNIDPQQILAKKSAEEIRVREEKLIAIQIIEDVKIASRRAYEVGDKSELVRLAAVQANAEQVAYERNQELAIIAEQKRLIQEMENVIIKRRNN